MISVKASASSGATRCHCTWVCENPCSNSSGGPLPPTRAKMRPDLVLIHSDEKPGNRSARSGMMYFSFVMAGLVPAIHVFEASVGRRGCPAQAGHDDERFKL